MLNIDQLEQALELCEKSMQHAYDANRMDELAVWERRLNKVQDRIDQYHYEAGLARAAAEDASEDGAFERI